MKIILAVFQIGKRRQGARRPRRRRPFAARGHEVTLLTA